MKKRFNKLSRSGQDIFAYQIAGPGGTYLEIGSADVIRGSNTYSLEKHHGWTGMSLEVNKNKYLAGWAIRTNVVYWQDALTFDYSAALRENKIQVVDYLQLDIDPPKHTFEALKRVLEQGIDFKCCTFEHDIYKRTPDEPNYKILADDLMEKHGYKIAVEHVMSNTINEYCETWYVKNSSSWKPRNHGQWLFEVSEWSRVE